jgi:hypothetical protein
VNALIEEALTHHKISLQVSPESEKDYIAIEDIVELLPRIVRDGRYRIYNVASGVNRMHGSMADTIAELTGCDLETLQGAPKIAFPPIDVSRIVKEFHFSPSDIKKTIKNIIHACAKEKGV